MILFMVKERYGAGYENLISVMLDSNDMSIGEICKGARIEAEDLRHMMIILVKHDLITAVEGGNRFKVNIDQCIYFIVCDQFISFVEDHLNPSCKDIIECFMINGKMNVYECIEGNFDGSSTHLLEFQRLVNLDYLIALHAAQKINQNQEDEFHFGDNLVKRRPEALESQQVGGKLGQNGSKKTEEPVLSIESPTFRNEITKELNIYKINYKKLLHDIRTGYFTTTVRQRYGTIPSIIVKHMMANSSSHGRCSETNHSQQLTVFDIQSSIDNKEIQQESILAILENMMNDNMKLVKSYKYDDDLKYSVNMYNILYYNQLKMIEYYVSNKFNDNKYVRVLRCVSFHHMCNDKQIEEVCLINIKNVRAILIDLIKEGIIQQHEINVSKNIYVYSISVSSFLQTYRDIIMKSKLNISVNISRHLNHDPSILNKYIHTSYHIDHLIMYFYLF